jgi:hypothetical protein
MQIAFHNDTLVITLKICRQRRVSDVQLKLSKSVEVQ